MRRRNFALCCCTLLFVISSSEPRENSTTTTSDNERNNSTVRYQIHINVTTTNRSGDAETTRYNARGNSTRSNDDVQYELRLNSTSIHEDDDSVGYEFHAHSTKDRGGGDQTSIELRTNSTDDKIISTAHEPRGNLMQDVIEDRSNLTLYKHFVKFYQNDNKRNVVPYEMCENSICIPLCCPLGVRTIKGQCVAENVGRYPFPGVYEQATNESLEKGPIGEVDQIFQLTVHDLCQKVEYYLLKPDEEPNDAFMFLLNGSLCVINIIVVHSISGFVIYFSALASYFWLNVICFDIWWTFGEFRSLQGNVKQREKKKFVMYSIYAWGSASILTVICVIMDFVPISVPKEFIRPEFGKTKCWFNTNKAMAIYFIGPIGVTVICNICLFISTARKIVRQKKDTAAHLRSSESRRHDNKQRRQLFHTAVCFHNYEIF
ncbi:uncharacterized protein LOC112451881 [Temnothorax curvispinosus]|uniref:Uncharacterized protein LOC112451881 n=1 Tax=Temnothorax curvispinosus TaxID=300111 RepID=A0A6J1PDF3_9HYME|nr:uncharacterized protein LOC112451881 [Temnothorax curvispinosus]